MKSNLDRLNEEARVLAEPFSPELHARVMGAVRAAPPAHNPRPLPWRRYALAAAAIAALAAGILLRPQPTNPPPPPMVRADLSAVSNLLTNTAAPVRETLQTGLPDQTYASLDHDAATLARFMARQLDQLPQRPARQ